MNLTTIINEATGLKLKKPMASKSDADKTETQEKILQDMMVNIMPKFNGADNRDIQASNGDITKYKYYSEMMRTTELLTVIANRKMAGNNRKEASYQTAETLYDNAQAARRVLVEMAERREKLRYYYVKGDVFTVLTYTATVKALAYGLSYLIAEMIRFDEIDGQMEVEIQSSSAVAKCPHLRLVKEMADLYTDGTMDKVYKLAEERAKDTVTETVTKEMDEIFTRNAGGLNEGLGISVVGAPLANIISTGIGAFPIILAIMIIAPFVVWKIIPLVREVLYTVYYTRVKIEESIDLQVALLETNIEALENRKMDKKIIARQKGVIKLLNSAKSVIAVKIDDADTKALREINVENRKMGLSNNDFENPSDSGLML